MRLNASLWMVCPRHVADPLAPTFMTLPKPPPSVASAVSTAAWSLVIPASSDRRSM